MIDIDTLALHCDDLTNVRSGWATVDQPETLNGWEQWLSRYADDYQEVNAFVMLRLRTMRPDAVSECGGGAEACYWVEIDGTIYGLGTQHYAYALPAETEEPDFPAVTFLEELE